MEERGQAAGEAGLRRFCRQFIEAGWLAAVILVPVYFNPSSTQIFEPDKIALLRSLAVLMAAAWLLRAVAGVQGGRAAALWRAAGTGWKTPAALAAGLVLVSYAVSAALSILPRMSLWGYHERLGGLYTAAAYLVIFFSLTALLRTRDQVRRLMSAVLLASVPVALYGLAQYAGADPLPWRDPIPGRVHAMLGNPAFLGGMLALVIPLTGYRLVVAGRRRRFVGAGGYGLLLALQGACLVFTGSRGPVLGLAIGLFFGGMLWALARGRRRLAQGLAGLSLVGGALLVLVNVPGSPLAFVEDVPYLSRLTRLADAEGSARGRLLIWEGAVRIAEEAPGRMVFGYGPETARFVFFPHYDPELGRIHGWGVSFDRMHNEMLDALVMRGGAGLLAYLLLITTLVYTGVRALGLAGSRRRRMWLLGLWGLGGVAAVGALPVLGLPTALAGVALPLGLLGGLFVYLAGQAFAGVRVKTVVGAERAVLIAALLASLLAHFAEIQVGVAAGASRLLFWVGAALLIVTARGDVARSEAPEAPERPPLLEGLGVGLAVTTLLFSFTGRAALPGTPLLVGGLVGSAWLGGVLLYGAGGSPWRAVQVGALAALPALLFLGVRAGVDAERSHLLIYCGVAAASLAAASAGVGRWRGHLGWRHGGAALIVGVAAGVAIYTTNLRPVLASQHVQAARQAIGQEQPTPALAHYRRALNLAPRHEAHALEYARVVSRLAQYHPAGGAERDGLYREAERVLAGAVAHNPYEPEHRMARAELYRRWAGTTAAAEGRRMRYERALAAYDDALGLAPESVPAWQGRAETFAEMGDRRRALAAFEEVLARDSTNATRYRELAVRYREAGQERRAAALFEGALRHARQPQPGVHQALAVLYRRQGRPGEALSHSRQAVRLAPGVPSHHQVLVGLLETLGRCPEALRAADAALQRWPAHGGLTAQVARLGQQCAPAGPP